MSILAPIGSHDACIDTLSGQIDTFLEELRFFIQMSEEEHAFQMTPNLPTVEEYSRRRKGSSAVRVCLAITE